MGSFQRKVKQRTKLAIGRILDGRHVGTAGQPVDAQICKSKKLHEGSGREDVAGQSSERTLTPRRRPDMVRKWFV